MPNLGTTEEDKVTGEQKISGMVPPDQVTEMLGADPQLAYTDPAIATRMVELVANSDNLVLLGDPEMFSPEVLEIVGPFLEDASPEESEMMYGENEGAPMEAEAPVEMTSTESVNPMTGTQTATETVSADLGDSAKQVTAEQLAKILNEGGSPEEGQREAMLSLLAELTGGTGGN